MNSKSWQSFDGRIRMLKQHLQLSDLALTLANKKANICAGNGRKIAEVLRGSLDTHRQLNIPNEKKDISRTFITSRNKLHEQAIIELYSEFSNYVASIISEIEHKHPKRFLSILSENCENGIKYKDIIKKKLGTVLVIHFWKTLKPLMEIGDGSDDPLLENLEALDKKGVKHVQKG